MTITDKDRIDFLQALTDNEAYTGKVILRLSIGRGWRLHETGRDDASESVRDAIDKFVKKSGERNGVHSGK